MNFRRDDGSSCSGCGCDMEVIGPPGPRHASDCPYDPETRFWPTGNATVTANPNAARVMLEDELLAFLGIPKEFLLYPVPGDPARPHSCVGGAPSTEPSWWAKDAQGIELCRVCDKCETEKLAQYRPEILTGYDQNDVDEPIDDDY